VPEPERSKAILLTQNYSQASAVNLFGGRSGLPRALSGHNSYWLWLPPRVPIDTVVAVGFTPAQLRQWFGRLSPLGRIPDDRHIDVEERGARIFLCTQPLVTTKQLWAAVKLFS